MKYVTPKAEIEMIEVKDVIAASLGDFEIVNTSEGKGNVVFSASGLFGIR